MDATGHNAQPGASHLQQECHEAAMAHSESAVAVLFLAPHRGRKGGVSAHCRVVQAALARSHQVALRVVYTGRPTPRGSAISAWIRDTASIAATGRVLHLNTSLRRRALARDVWLAAAAVRAAGLVWHVHGWDPDLADEITRSRSWGRSIRRRLRGGVAAAVSPQAVAQLRAWGVRAEQLGPAVDLTTLVRRPEAGRVLFMGRLVQAKGPLELLAAVARSVDAGRDLTLVMAGDGPERARIERAVRDAGLTHRVELRGWLGPHSVRQELSRAAVVVLPSEDEAMPLAALEAVAAGCPVVACPVGGLPALLPAHWLGPSTPDALAERIDAVMGAAVPAALVQRVRADHGAEAVGSRLVQLWQRAAR